MPDLVALDLPPGPAFVTQLRKAWDAGDAVLPVDQRLPAAAKASLLAALAPSVVIGPGGGRTGWPHGQPMESGDAVVVATSGSTGPPKGVILTHDALSAHARAVHDRLEVDPARHRWLACLPVAHVGGFGVITRALITGTPLDVLEAFDAAMVAVWGEAHRGRGLVSLVPTALDRVDPAPFRWVVLGGSSDPTAASRPGNVIHTYGLTESGGGVVYDGFPLAGIEVRIVDGKIQLRGAPLLRAYRDGTDPKSADGWLVTGDVGSLDPGTGSLAVDGRAGELIVTGGENVWPTAVEAVLGQHPDIDEVAVAGRPDAQWGHRVVAWIVTKPRSRPPTLDQLRGFAKQHLPAHAAPRELILVDQLPRTPLGKIHRAALTQPPDDPGA